jgi:hypothetical protein
MLTWYSSSSLPVTPSKASVTIISIQCTHLSSSTGKCTLVSQSHSDVMVLSTIFMELKMRILNMWLDAAHWVNDEHNRSHTNCKEGDNCGLSTEIWPCTLGYYDAHINYTAVSATNDTHTNRWVQLHPLMNIHEKQKVLTSGSIVWFPGWRGKSVIPIWATRSVGELI